MVFHATQYPTRMQVTHFGAGEALMKPGSDASNVGLILDGMVIAQVAPCSQSSPAWPTHSYPTQPSLFAASTQDHRPKAVAAEALPEPVGDLPVMAAALAGLCCRRV